MEHVRKNFGFGCMRLPMDGENVNIPETKQMVDAFLDAGFNYFDTARGYLQGKSETALRECLTSRYPRERYILTDKLTANFLPTSSRPRRTSGPSSRASWRPAATASTAVPGTSPSPICSRP